MRIKGLSLCSASLAALMVFASPAWAQQPVPPAQPAPTDTSEPAAPAQDDAAAAAQTGPAAPGDEIIVTGIRASLRSAQNIRRNSNQIVDAVVAEDIGKLPDINVSESLARIPGVQIDRANGEGADVSIRGLRGATTTYNGREIFTAEARNVATQDFPAGGVAALEVFKSTTAEQVEAGIAGLINVRSRRAFDFPGLEVSGSLNGTYADQSESTNVNGNLLLSNRWETGSGAEIGALINFSYTALDYLDSARFNSGDIRTSPEGFRYPGSVGIFYGPGRRRRPSVNASLQFRPAPEIEFYVDALYQGFRRERDDRLFDVNLRDATFTNVTLRPGTNAAQSLTAQTVNRIFRFQGATYDQTDTFQVAVGAVYTGERLRVAADLATTSSRFDLSVLSFDSLSNANPRANVNFDVPSSFGGVEFDLPGFNPNDPNNYFFGGLFEREFYAKGEDVQARLDLTYETELPFITELMAGVRYVDRTGERANGERFTGGGGPLSAAPVELYITPAGFRGSEVQPLRTWVTPTYDSIRDNVSAIRSAINAPNSAPVPNINLNVREESYAAYGQLNYEFEVGPFQIDGVAGLRVVRTEFRYINEPVTDFTDYLPNVSLRARFGDGFVIRGAFTQTRTRPAFEQLAPTLLDPPVVGQPFRTGGGGNPTLQPIQSDNYDLSAEYYFTRTGFATVSLFRRDIVGFITNLRRTIQDPVFGELRLNRPENGGQGRLEGVEAQVTTFFDFDFMPRWAHGFGVQANYTFIDAGQAFPADFGAPLTAQFDIPNVSRHTYNIAGFYEDDVFTARLAYNRRTRFVNSFDNAQAGVLSGEFTDDVSRLDFSASFKPIENVTIAFDVSNILGEPFQNFRNYTNEGDTYPRDVRYEERVFSLGVRFRL